MCNLFVLFFLGLPIISVIFLMILYRLRGILTDKIKRKRKK